MSPGRVYIAGLVAVAVGGAGVAALLAGSQRTAVLVSLLLSVAVQGPLGWWLVRTVGTQRFLGVWVIGILARFGVLGIMALLVFPALGWPLSPALPVLGGLLLALLLLEGLVVWLEHSQGEAR